MSKDENRFEDKFLKDNKFSEMKDKLNKKEKSRESTKETNNVRSLKENVEEDKKRNAAIEKIKKLQNETQETKQKGLYIYKKQDDILKYLAKETNRSESEIMRMALDYFFEELDIEIKGW